MTEMQSPADAHLLRCWRNQDCGSCLSTSNCGWCPYTSSCVPATSLFSPIGNENICPHWAERWELRTKTLGCGCSTITLLTALITILCTLVGVVVLYGLWRAVNGADRVWGTGSWGGYQIVVGEEGEVREGRWTRSVGRWWRRKGLKDVPDQRN